MSEQSVTQPGVGTHFYHEHDVILEIEKARLYRAAAGVGGVAVTLLHIEGETAEITNMMDRNRSTKPVTIPEGHVHLLISGTFDRRGGGTGPFFAKVRELEAQQASPTQTPEPAMLDFSI